MGNNLPIDDLADDVKLNFHGWSVKASGGVVVAFSFVLIVIWAIFEEPSNVFSAVHPRMLFSTPAIFISNFFHWNIEHLTGNLIWFAPLGFLVFKWEGARGLVGIFIGMLGSGVAVWLFSSKGIASAGFSGAVMACWGILFISAIRRDYRLVVVFLFLSYMFLENQLFETIRPTKSAIEGNISWLGHLGGLIGGMAAQIRSLPVALELLYKGGKITNEEFLTIAKRIQANKMADLDAKSIPESAGGQAEVQASAVSQEYAIHEKPNK